MTNGLRHPASIILFSILILLSSGCSLWQNRVAFNDVVGDKYFPSEGTSMLFAPRVGVELLYHIRLMAQFNISRKGYNNFSLTIGFVLGGRPKK